MRAERLPLGAPTPPGLVGTILTRDLLVGGRRLPKGRCLTEDDLAAISRAGEGRGRSAVTVLALEPGDVHEDEAARRLARAVAGPGLVAGEPHESRVDLRAAVRGVVRVRLAALERVNRVEPVEVFTLLDGQVVEAGTLVASAKVAPHVVDEAVVARAEAVAGPGAATVDVTPLRTARIAVVVKEAVRGPARDRFESSVRRRVEGLGSEIASFAYVADDAGDIAAALDAATRGPERARVLLLAGAASTDPLDPAFEALERVGGRIVRRGVPAHPGSMLWLARLRGTTILGLPTCGAYSKATAADLLLPRLLAGEPASAATVARLGHGGVLGREMRFRFPAYARELAEPDG